ncbi:hypothetical protein V1517DRAFT_95078 [Lipomyces orientalis]|uniref:Uncharacterized protein n=1 Tax=Lipomyces orientalis TaxID=1233043 RepID=A0ACC3TCB9_9ASCO
MASSVSGRHTLISREKSVIVPHTSARGPSQNGTRHLVVCGVVETRDVWLFGDFLGFVATLKEHGVHETFINSFDLDKYFRDEGFTDVKFGGREEIGDDDWDSDDHIVMYTKWEWEHRSPWWIQVKPQEERTLGSKVLDWIREQANESKPKDIVSIILIGHGSPEGITLGGVNFSPSDLAGACSLFRTDVQVNVVVKACHSGTFASAFRVTNQRNIYVHTSAQVNEKSYSARRSISGLRNSHFGQAFVRTLGLTRDIDDNWTLQKQKSYIQERLSR